MYCVLVFDVCICPRRSMDRTQLCGSCDVGSIPTEGTRKKGAGRGNYL